MRATNLYLDSVKIRLDGLTVPSEVSELLKAIVTLAVGWLFSFIVNVALSPYSVVIPELELIVKPALSLSVLTAVISEGSRPL